MIPLMVLTAALAWMGVQGTGRRVCSFSNWAQYRPGTGKYLPQHINATLCTHIAIAFGKMSDTLGPLEWNDESTAYRKGTFQQIAELKSVNPDLKVLLSIGGWNVHSTPFDRILLSQDKTKWFAVEAAKYLRSKDIDGLDVDWEYPTNKAKYNILIKILKDAFVAEARDTGRERLLLTSAVSAGKSHIDKGYDVRYIANLMDYITVMTFDLHGSWDKNTGHHSAMYAGHWETGVQRYLNVDWVMDYWHRLGVPKSKLNLGLPMYGRCFTLQSTNQNDVNAPSTGPSTEGKFTREAGFLSYYEICEMIQQGAVRKVIPDQKVPYVVQNDQWCGYDDVESIIMKVKYVMSKGYGGISVWSMDLDDFNGVCGKKYPLMTAIFEEMPFVGPISTEKDWNTTTTMKPLNTEMNTTRPTTISVEPCTGNKNGVYPDVRSCQYFWICVPGDGGRIFDCPPKTLYDDALKTYPSDPCIGTDKQFMPNAYECRNFWICDHGKGHVNTCPGKTLWNREANICDFADNVICPASSQI